MTSKRLVLSVLCIGQLKGLHAVRWATVRDMVLAWIVTLPVAGILAGLAYLILSKSL